MARNIVAIIVGLTVSFAIYFTILSANNNLHPLPPGLDQTDAEAMNEHMKTLPAMAFIIELIAHLLGVIGGSWIASILAQSHERKISIGIGLFLLSMGAINIITGTRPTWFMIADFLIYIPGAMLGYTLYKMRKPANV